MKLLFIQGGSRVRRCINGDVFVDGNFNDSIWNRYKNYSTELTVILRKTNSFYSEDELVGKFNKINTNIMNLKLVDDVYSPKKNFISFAKRKNIKRTIKEEVKKADFIIIRSIGNFYTNTALKYCKKMKKRYLIEVTGFAFEGLWYHSFLGKLVSIPRELKLRKSIKAAPYAVYVTEKKLQERYKCDGKTLGCSDVEITKIDDKDLENRKERLTLLAKKKKNNILKLGTAAFLNVKWKGQQDVIKAIYELKREGIIFKYELIGGGNSDYLTNLIEKFDLKNEVSILGAKTHYEVFEWMKQIDVYIQPSYQEGLCRSLVEAMSVASPIICTNVGGNSELINKDMIYRKGNIKELKEILKKVSSDNLKKHSEMNFFKAKNYKKDILDERRDNFYKECIKEG